MAVLRSAIIKELLNLSRDLHGLLLLFVMPAVFILIMSLALKGQFDERSRVLLTGGYENADTGELADRSLAFLKEINHLSLLQSQSQVQPQSQPQSDEDSLSLVKQDKLHFYLKFPKGYSDYFSEEDVIKEPVQLFVAPSVTMPTRLLLEAAVHEAVARTRLEVNLEEMGAPEDIESTLTPEGMIELSQFGQIEGEATLEPTAVQQSVPAWLVFSMFFVVVPLSATFIGERQQGTLARLKTLPAPGWLLLLAKIIPYSVINLLQLFIMLCIGAWLVPALGGDALSLNISFPGLLIITVAVSFAAQGMAMAIATVAKTTDQATTLGGVGNLLFGALGGIMVPTFLMPLAMQQASVISPMSWGLQGYLDILLRGGSIPSVLPEAGALLLWGGVMLSFAAYRYQKM